MSVGAVNKQTGDRIPTAGMPAIDNALDLMSVNPVQNAVITAALAGKADTGIVADDFDSTASYVIGNYCIENGKLYRFKANHSGAWAAADVDEIQIAGELSSLESGLTNVTTQIKGLNSVWKMTQNSAGDVTFTTDDNRFTGFLLITGNNGKYAVYIVNVSVQGGTHIVKLIGDDYTITYSNKTLTVTLDSNWSKVTLVTDTPFS